MKKLLIIIILVMTIFIGYNNIGIPKENIKEPNNEIKENKDLFGKYYDKSEKIVNKMTIEEKIGQLFLVRYDSNTALNEIRNYYPGGYILFARDFENHTKDSIKKELNNLQEESKTPLILGVDEEGGYVTRVSRFKNFRDEKFPSPKSIYEQGGYELLEQVEKEKLELLLSIGLNFNLAPVADISTDENDFMYERSFGKDKDETAVYIKNMVKYANDLNISSCLKHFPGYGNNIDTHNNIAIDNREYENFVNNDFIPFESGIKEKVPVILMSHNIVLSMDKKYPASLSNNIHKILRNELEFSGIIITDDLAMDAVTEYVDNKEAATLAINAGNDMIITSDFVNMKNELLKSVKENKITKKKIDKAVKRIIAWKLAYQIK